MKWETPARRLNTRRIALRLTEARLVSVRRKLANTERPNGRAKLTAEAARLECEAATLAATVAELESEVSGG